MKTINRADDSERKRNKKINSNRERLAMRKTRQTDRQIARVSAKERIKNRVHQLFLVYPNEIFWCF